MDRLTRYSIININNYNNYYDYCNFKIINKNYYNIFKNYKKYINIINIIKTVYIKYILDYQIDYDYFKKDYNVCLLCKKYDEILNNKFMIYTKVYNITVVETYCRPCFYRCMFNFVNYNNRYPTLEYHDGMNFSRSYSEDIYINRVLMAKLPMMIYCYRYNIYDFWNNLLYKK